MNIKIKKSVLFEDDVETNKNKDSTDNKYSSDNNNDNKDNNDDNINANNANNDNDDREIREREKSKKPKTPRILSSYKTLEKQITINNKQFKIHERWKGNNKFCCKGYIYLGPGYGWGFLTSLYILVYSLIGLFFVFMVINFINQ